MTRTKNPAEFSRHYRAAYSPDKPIDHTRGNSSKATAKATLNAIRIIHWTQPSTRQLSDVYFQVKTSDLKNHRNNAIDTESGSNNTLILRCIAIDNTLWIATQLWPLFAPRSKSAPYLIKFAKKCLYIVYFCCCNGSNKLYISHA